MKDLTTVAGSYVFALTKNSETISKMSESKEVGTEEFRTFVRNVVMSVNDRPLELKSPDTKKFIFNLERKKSKYEITMLVYNSMLAGAGCTV